MNDDHERGNYYHDDPSFYQPRAPPPAAPPPPPAFMAGAENLSSWISTTADSTMTSLTSAYQQTTAVSSSSPYPSSSLYGTAATVAGAVGSAVSASPSHAYNALPSIRYEEEDGFSQQSQDVRSFFGAGDATLNPNVRGLSNSYDYSLFGLAAHEILEKVRLTNLIASFGSIGLLLSDWIWATLTLQWMRLVLSIYLGFLSALLLTLELSSLWYVYFPKPSVTDTSTTRATMATSNSSSNKTAPRYLIQLEKFIESNFGLLQHPIGKSAFVLMLATLCWGISSLSYGINFLTALVLGTLYFGSSVLLLLLWITDPVFRKQFQTDDDDDGGDEYGAQYSDNNANNKQKKGKVSSLLSPTPRQAPGESSSSVAGWSFFAQQQQHNDDNGFSEERGERSGLLQ